MKKNWFQILFTGAECNVTDWPVMTRAEPCGGHAVTGLLITCLGLRCWRCGWCWIKISDLSLRQRVSRTEIRLDFSFEPPAWTGKPYGCTRHEHHRRSWYGGHRRWRWRVTLNGPDQETADVREWRRVHRPVSLPVAGYRRACLSREYHRRRSVLTGGGHLFTVTLASAAALVR